MQNRVPVVRDEGDKAVLAQFTPVPRQKVRHDGWTPERQRAFIAALADTGSVTRAAGMVNMAQTNCYTLRRAPGAESFAAAWDAALDFGVARLKDIAFERAIDGQLVPRFAGGKLMGFQRKRNDALLMFLLRHYGRDWRQRPGMGVTRAKARATARGDGAAVEVEVSSGATAHPTLAGGESPPSHEWEELLESFEGVELDAAARGEIEKALLACAERQRVVDGLWHGGSPQRRQAIEQDASTDYIEAPPIDPERAESIQRPYHESFADPWLATVERGAPFKPGEPDWTELGDDAEIERDAAPVAVKRPRRHKKAA